MLFKRPFLTVLALSSWAVTAQADTYILVHGAFQSSSDWDAVATTLEAENHSVVAVNLPGRDAEGEAAKEISLQSYVDSVTAALEEADAPVHLVAHSFGGMTISAVADATDTDIATLVYIAAYLPQPGDSMQSLAKTDIDNGFTEKSFVIAPDYSHAEILESDKVRLFAADGTETQQAQLLATMVREPLGPIGTEVALTNGKLSQANIVYIRTLNDQTVSTQMQTRMIERAGVMQVADIESGHSPHLTQPDRLGALIVELTQ